MVDIAKDPASFSRLLGDTEAFLLQVKQPCAVPETYLVEFQVRRFPMGLQEGENLLFRSKAATMLYLV
jgi:hypothetical protein